MKAFLAALCAIVVLAGGAWAVLPSLFARSADETFASSGARVGKRRRSRTATSPAVRIPTASRAAIRRSDTAGRAQGRREKRMIPAG